MSIDDLECHLLELQEKKMKTRGVLRKLILLHSNLGNIERVKELRKQFLEMQYEESLGMKSSVLHAFIKQKCLEDALTIYKDIKEIDPNFFIDDFKILDLCTLLISNNQVSEAWIIIKGASKNK